MDTMQKTPASTETATARSAADLRKELLVEVDVRFTVGGDVPLAEAGRLRTALDALATELDVPGVSDEEAKGYIALSQAVRRIGGAAGRWRLAHGGGQWSEPSDQPILRTMAHAEHNPRDNNRLFSDLRSALGLTLTALMWVQLGKAAAES